MTTIDPSAPVLVTGGSGYIGEYMLNVNANGTVNFFIYGSGGYQFDLTTTTTVNNGQWHYIAATRSGTAGAIYIDGVQAASGSVRLPGSKSISNRLLLLAALAEGESRIHDLLDADDTAVMLAALRELGCDWRREGELVVVPVDSDQDEEYWSHLGLEASTPGEKEHGYMHLSLAYRSSFVDDEENPGHFKVRPNIPSDEAKRHH